MKKINLRDLYPFYNSDFFIEIADEVGTDQTAIGKNMQTRANPGT